MKTIVCQGKNITVRQSGLSRRLRLSVNRKGQITVSAPLFCSARQIQEFVNRHTDWLNERLIETRPEHEWHDGDTLSVVGQTVTIRHNPTLRQGVFIREGILYVSGDAAFITRRVTDFIKRETRAYFETHARALAARIGAKVHQIHLKDTTSRWGSCSSRGNLNFCWRLGLAPAFVLDYITAHEVAHLMEMNHSDDFWRLVGRLTNHRADAEIWLRRYGKTL